MSEYQVFVKTSADGRIVAVNSNAFLVDTSGWTQVDSGVGDKFHHAQNNYLPKPIADESGVFQYEYINSSIVERSAEEKEKDYAQTSSVMPTLDERVSSLEREVMKL